MNGSRFEAVGELTVPGDPAAVSTGRRWIRDVLTDVDPERLYDIQLMTSEALANAVEHGRGDPRICLARNAEAVRVSVTDHGGGDRIEPLRPGPDDQNGRGLLLIDEISAAWGVGGDDHETTVWFEAHV